MKTLLFVMGLGVSGVAAMAPRALANGRPACGNTMGKGRRVVSQSCVDNARLVETAAKITPGLVTTVYVAPPPAPDPVEVARVLLAEDDAALAALEPRRLANGRPACGNTGGKVAMDEEHACTSGELAAIAKTRRAIRTEKTKHEAQLIAATLVPVPHVPELIAILATTRTGR